MRRSIKKILISSVILTLVGCGGGSTGGNPPSSDSPNMSSSSSTSSSSSSSSSSFSSTSSVASGGSDSSTPTAKILFPVKDAQTSRSMVTVRGTATDDTGIQSVTVNGVAANIQPVNAGPGLQKAESDATVEWEVTLELELGDTEIQVEVEDTSGNTDEEPEEVLIRYSKYPTNVLLDSANDRLVGMETYGKGLALDLAASVVSEVPAVTAGDLLATNALGTEVYSISEIEGVLTIRSVELASGIESVVQTTSFTYDKSAWELAFLWDSAYVESDNIVYMLYQLIPLAGGNWQSQIHVWDLSENTITPLPLFVDGGVVPAISGVKNRGDNLYGLGSPFIGNASTNTLFDIDIESGEISIIASEIDALATHFVVDASAEFAYLAGYDAVVGVNLETGAAETISLDAGQELFNFAQIRSVILDESREFLYVSDSAIREMIAVDLKTGSRSLLYPNGIGEGRKLITPRELALTADNQFAYVLDDGDNAPESLFRIDLESGDREQLGDIAAEYNDMASGLALDETNNRVFYSLYNNIFVMDLTDNSVTPISSETEGTGVILDDVFGLHYDSVAERILVVDSANDRLIGIDPTTKSREVLALLAVGESPVIEGPVDVAVSADGTTYYVLGQKQAALYAVDAETGIREVLLDSCLNKFSQEQLPVDSSVQNMDFNPTLSKFLLTGDNSIVEYDLVNDSCRVVSEEMNVFDLLYQNDGTILGSSWNSILQFDAENGEYITLSK